MPDTVSVAVKLWVPFAKVPVAKLQAPPALTVAVPRFVEPSNTVTLSGLQRDTFRPQKAWRLPPRGTRNYHRKSAPVQWLAGHLGSTTGSTASGLNPQKFLLIKWSFRSHNKSRKFKRVEANDRPTKMGMRLYFWVSSLATKMPASRRKKEARCPISPQPFSGRRTQHAAFGIGCGAAFSGVNGSDSVWLSVAVIAPGFGVRWRCSWVSPRPAEQHRLD